MRFYDMVGFMLFLKVRRVLVGMFLIFLFGALCDWIMDKIVAYLVGEQVLRQVLYMQLWYCVHGVSGVPGFLTQWQASDIYRSWTDQPVTLDFYERFLSGNLRLTVFMQAASYSNSAIGLVVVGVVTFISGFVAVIKHFMPTARSLWNNPDAGEVVFNDILGKETPVKSDPHEDMIENAFGDESLKEQEKGKMPQY